ncbi:hypothetical protein D9619_003895 [Psilocybe cf. subviscida]|uniref:DNA-directed RNA polymerase n=1 Tax=Psilocybe cf. subviscida TaxID=2480587 RepID=A0A8H5BPY2_9AGAR|nr:hypothetical protein D9619_003895 [Psilocybe cf. subviscida]
MPYSTFRLNLSVTPPYNADSDGDEMNMHVPQSEETRAGLAQIAWLPCQIISPQANKPVMGIVQDTLCEYPSPKPLWTGKQILSLVIPRGINIHRSPDPKSSTPVFDDGILIETETWFSVSSRRRLGNEAAAHWPADGCQLLAVPHGFSIGIGDTIADSKTVAHITQIISDRKAQVAQIIDDATHDRLKAAPGMTIRELFESLVEYQLNLARDTSGQYVQKHLKEDNNVKQMAVAGSKGSFINIAQMSVCVGQQSVEGRRIPFGFRHRTLPHFTKDDLSPESRGFVENSYLRGLTPQEFFFCAMAGHEGLIDTAVKTAETGYIQRRLVKALEDVTVCYDGTVRNSLGDLIQFVYGEDGMDGAFIEKQTIETFSLNDREFEHNYRVDVTDPSGGFMQGVLQTGIDDRSLKLQSLLDKEYARLAEDQRHLRDFAFPCVPTTQPHYFPFNLQRIMQNAIQIFHIDRRKPSDLEPAYIIDSIRELDKRLIVVRGDDTLSVEAQENVTLTFRMHLRATFAARRVLEKFHLTREAFNWVSIGEPATQMTLNTFHYAGVSSKNVTLGVPLNPEISASSKLAKDVQQELAYTSLRTVTAAVEIWYHPDPAATIIPDDSIFVHAFFEIPDEEVESKMHLQSSWQFRLELDCAKIIDRKLSMQYVVGRIAESFKSDLFAIWSEDSSEKLIIRCRVIGADKGEGDDGVVEEDIFLRQLEGAMLDSVSLRGVKGTNRVFLTEQVKITVSTEGSTQIGKEKEWVLETDGINLKTVMCIDDLDFRRTYSNNCVEIFHVLGIEAARAANLKELRGVIEFDGSYVNYRHLALLCDLMTHRGSLMAITRHGINRADTGALMRCSCGETVEILMEAAAVGGKDNCHDIAENVMFGWMAPMGTGAFEVALDIDILKDAIVDHRLSVQTMLASQLDSGMMPGQVAMTPYNSNSPMWHDGMFKGDAASAAFSPLESNGGDDAQTFQPFLGYGFGPLGTGGMSPGGPGYSPSSPNVQRIYPNVPELRSSVTPSGRYVSDTLSDIASPQFYLAWGYSPASPRYSPTSSPSFSPISPRHSPQSPSFSPTSPRYSPTSPSFSSASPRYSPTPPHTCLRHLLNIHPPHRWRPSCILYNPDSIFSPAYFDRRTIAADTLHVPLGQPPRIEYTEIETILCTVLQRVEEWTQLKLRCNEKLRGILSRGNVSSAGNQAYAPVVSLLLGNV